MEYLWQYESPVGWIHLASDGEALIGLWIEGQKYFSETLGEAVQGVCLPVFEKTAAWLDAYFAGKQPAILGPQAPKLAPHGSEFRQMVWQILCEIPYGGLTTYGAIARRIAEKTGKSTMSAQAVGGAVGHNPISIIIPCHRVVGSGGSLTGYAGGLDKKIQLLTLEGADMAGLYRPKKGTAL
ncbi:MAG: methylated-DNA--[protein]-cysteine S-methyltransferase [Lachnospiraceae bacterium]|nr:methylated-DNA--[protein]-cysteine S-methyltransferase [Lachnospiraceae bacterium]